MFRITIVTDDKKLPRLLRAFKGLIIGPPEVYLLEGAEEVNGELRETEVDSEIATGGRTPAWAPTRPRQPGKRRGVGTKQPGETLPDRVALKLLNQKPDVLTSDAIAKATEAAGSSRNSYSYVIVALRKWGILTGPNAAGIYNINEAAYHKRIEGGH